MTPSEACLNLVKRFEGCRLTAYPDPATGGDPWTVGFGHTGPEVRRGLTISQDIADAYLLKDVTHAAGVVEQYVTVPLTQGQFDACVSLVFNIGPGSDKRDGIMRLKNGQPSTFLRKLNAGDYLGAANEILRWDSHHMPGLVRRRAAEQALFQLGG